MYQNLFFRLSPTILSFTERKNIERFMSYDPKTVHINFNEITQNSKNPVSNKKNLRTNFAKRGQMVSRIDP